MKHFLFVIIAFLFPILTFTQTLINSSDYPTYLSAAEGDLYIDENGQNYLGLTDGSLQILADISDIESTDNTILIDNTSVTFFFY